MQFLGELAGDLAQQQAFAVQLGKTLDIVVDERDTVPGRAADDAVHSQVELLLEGTHRPLCVRVEDAVCRVDLRDVGVVGCNAVEAVLDDAHLLGDIAQPEGYAGPRAAEVGRDGCVAHKVDVVAVEIADDLLRAHALLSERYGTPLAESAGTGGGGAVAVLGEQRFNGIAPGQVVVEHIVHNF